MSPAGVPRSIGVEIAPEAWTRIGRLPSDAFQRIRALVESFSAEAATELRLRAERGEAAAMKLAVGGYVVTLELDSARSVLTIRDVNRVEAAGQV